MITADTIRAAQREHPEMTLRQIATYLNSSDGAVRRRLADFTPRSVVKPPPPFRRISYAGKP